MNELFLLSFIFSHIIVFIKKHKFTLEEQLKYNNFADCKHFIITNNYTNTQIIIYNFLNVISNIIFIFGGLYHIYTDPILCILSILVCAGSSYYHYKPNLDTLFYDRLPMVLTFNWLLIFRANLNIHESFIYNLIGIYSLYIWRRTNNLLPYATFQLTLILYWLICFECGMTYAIIFYFVAKICEDYDYQIYKLTNNYISGHSLKHIFAGLALFVM